MTKLYEVCVSNSANLISSCLQNCNKANGREIGMFNSDSKQIQKGQSFAVMIYSSDNFMM